MNPPLNRLHDAIRTYQCPGCAFAPECTSVAQQPLKNGCGTHQLSEMTFGARHGVVPGVPLDGPGWSAPALPFPFNVFPLRARTFPILLQPPGRPTDEVSAMLQHLDTHGNTLVRWYVGGPREGITTVHLGDVRPALPNVPELTREHLDLLSQWR